MNRVLVFFLTDRKNFVGLDNAAPKITFADQYKFLHVNKMNFRFKMEVTQLKMAVIVVNYCFQLLNVGENEIL